jgi:dipeptidyl aminopeptidase/acylaminoacyl peptidase
MSVHPLGRAAAAGPSPLDLLGLVTVDDPQLSSDGRFVAWRRGTIDAATDRTLGSLVVQPLDTTEWIEVVPPAAGVRSPRWMPDGGSLAYLASVNGANEVMVVPAAGGPSRALTSLGLPIEDLAVSPDSAWLALIARRPDAPERSTPRTGGPLRVTRLRWKRDGTGLVGDTFDHLLLLRVPGDGEPPTRRARSLLAGRLDVAGPSWSPDGRYLAFVAPPHDPEWERRRRAGVYVLEVARRGAQPRCVATFAELRTAAPAWAPDGRQLALTGHDADGIGHYGAQRLWVVDVTSATRRAVTTDRDGTFGNAAYTDTGGSGATGPKWTSDGRGVVAVLSRGAHVRLVRVDLAGRVQNLTAPDRVIAGFSLTREGSRAVVLSQPRDRSADLELIHLDPRHEISDRGGAASRRLTFEGERVLGGAAAALPRHLRVEDGRGPDLDAWVLLPQESTGRCPVILYTGGGPGGMRSDNLQFEWQVFASAGYAVVWANTRGCQGYGDPFCTAVLGSWGEADFHDNLRALDSALAAYPELDPQRQAIAGGSYGGYQVVWALAHTDRFRAAVADRAVVDKFAAFGMSDIGPQRAFEFGGALPWEDPHAYFRQSPIASIGSVRTPTLVVHSADDHRCTVGQGEALYASLRAQGVPTRLVRFPNESHGLSRSGRPWHRIRRLQEYLDWFGRYLA